LAGAGVAQRNGYALKRRVPAFLCKNEKRVPALGYIIKRSRLRTSGQCKVKTTKEEPNKEPRPGARNGKEEEIKKRNRKEQKGKEGATGASANHH